MLQEHTKMKLTILFTFNIPSHFEETRAVSKGSAKARTVCGGDNSGSWHRLIWYMQSNNSLVQQGKWLDSFEGWLRSLDDEGWNGKDKREIRRERRRWACGGELVDFGFERIGAGRSKRLDHMFISTYREQTHRIDKAGYSSEIWLHSMVLLVSEPSAHTSLTAWSMNFNVILAGRAPQVSNS